MSSTRTERNTHVTAALNDELNRQYAAAHEAVTLLSSTNMEDHQAAIRKISVYGNIMFLQFWVTTSHGVELFISPLRYALMQENLIVLAALRQIAIRADRLDVFETQIAACRNQVFLQRFKDYCAGPVTACKAEGALPVKAIVGTYPNLFRKTARQTSVIPQIPQTGFISSVKSRN